MSIPETSFRSEAAQARNAALRLLTTRPRTVAEMRERLASRFGADAIERTLARLQSEGLLDDTEFARQWRSSRERRKPRSRRMIEQELRSKGVAEDVVSNALEGYDSSDAAYRAAVRYAARQKGSGRATFDRRVGAFLERRGFEYGIIRQILQQLREELDVSETGDANQEGRD